MENNDKIQQLKIVCKVTFLEDIWNEIKSYLGIYSIPTKFKKMQNFKLETILEIVKVYSNENIESMTSYKNAKIRMESMKQYLIKYFWRSMLKHNQITKDIILQEIYKYYIENPFSKFVVGDTVFIYGYQTSYKVVEVKQKSLTIFGCRVPGTRVIKFLPS